MTENPPVEATMTETPPVVKRQMPVTRKAKTALVLASIAAAFFAGVMIRHWIW